MASNRAFDADSQPVPEQQAAIRKTRKLRDQGLALRAISERTKVAWISISHAGVKNTLAAADRAAPGSRCAGSGGVR
jgi:hypothetical protein